MDNDIDLMAFHVGIGFRGIFLVISAMFFMEEIDKLISDKTN